MHSFYDQAMLVLPRPVPKTLTGANTEFWGKQEPVLNTEGDVVRGGMWPNQKLWWELPNFIKAYIGGYGAGKTFIGAKRAISLALTNTGVPGAAVSPSFPIARHTTVATLKALLAGKRSIYGNQFWYRYNNSTHEFQIRFRGREGHIIVYSGEDPEALKGPNLGFAWIDEPFIQDEAVFKQMIARIRHPMAKHRELCLTGTPEQLNWGYDLCVGELRQSHDVGMIHSSTMQNLALPRDYVDRLRAAFPGKAGEAYIGGRFVSLSTGMVFYNWNSLPNEPETNVVELPVPESAELGAGMDFNVDPMSAAVFWRAGSHIHFFDEIELPNSDTQYMCDTLRERYGGRLQNIYPDASGNSRKTSSPAGRTDFWYIRNAGYTINCKAENPPLKDSYNSVNGKLKPVAGKPQMTVSPRCKKLIKYLSTYTHENKNTETGKKMSHLLDAMRYPVSYLFPAMTQGTQVHKLIGM